MIGGVAIIAIIVLIVSAIDFNRIIRNRGEDQYELVSDFHFDEGKGYKKRRIERIYDSSNIAFFTSSELPSNQSKYTDLYPESYRIPSMQEALLEAGYDKDAADSVIEECFLTGKRAGQEGHLFSGFTTEDATAVALYTYDFGSGAFENNPYRLINTALSGSTNNGLRKVRGMLLVVMSALRKLPRCSGETLYRGIRSTVDMEEYKKGSVITFHSLASTSTNMSTVKNFLLSAGGISESKKSIGTLFVIEGAWGYDIQPYSLFPEEREILLEPEMHFCVQSVITSDVVIVNLKMLDAPVILPGVFGSGDED